MLLIYRPVLLTLLPGGLGLAVGLGLGVRFLGFYAQGDGDGHVQSLILAAILSLGGFMLLLAGLLAEILAAHRLLVEDVQARVRRMELGIRR